MEEYSKRLQLKATYVHIAFYYENFYTFFPPQKGEDGNYYFGFPQGDTKLAMVAAEDLKKPFLSYFLFQKLFKIVLSSVYFVGTTLVFLCGLCFLLLKTRRKGITEITK